jgi:hypothetical protein
MDNRPIKFNKSGKYNLDFIDWNNEWERVGEIAAKIENGEEVSDKEEEERVRRHMELDLNKYGVQLNEFPLIPNKQIPTDKECYICLKNFKKNTKVRKLPCGHLFDEKCLQPWLKQNSTCPICKFELKPEEENEDNYDEF